MGMTDKKINKVLDLYHSKLLIDGPKNIPDKKFAHLLEMFPQMKTFLERGRREKVFRWLGFLQGVLFAFDYYTIDDMANHNRPTKSEIKELHPHHPFGHVDRDTTINCETCNEYENAPDDVTPT